MLRGLREAVGRLCCRLGWHCWRPAGYQLPGWYFCRDCREIKPPRGFGGGDVMA